LNPSDIRKFFNQIIDFFKDEELLFLPGFDASERFSVSAFV